MFYANTKYFCNPSKTDHHVDLYKTSVLTSQRTYSVSIIKPDLFCYFGK